MKRYIALIVILAAILRFVNFNNRWGLAYDQAHDVLVARHSLSAGKLPLLGPFSSAGPFQTGGQWYWLLMLAVGIYPPWVMTPWIVLAASYVALVYLMIRFGTELVDRRYGIVLGVLTAVSSAQIAQSVNLTNQSPIVFFSLFSLWQVLRYIRTKRARHLFFTGLWMSTAATIQLQGVGLYALLPWLVVLTGIPTLKAVTALFAGLILPYAPILLYDTFHQFPNIRNMVYYFFFEQQKASFDVLGRRWLTYIGVFWRDEWGRIIGGGLAGVLAGLAMVAYGFFGDRKSINAVWKVILAGFLTMVAVVRYTHTPLYPSYLMFLHPFLFSLVALGIYRLFVAHRIAGIAVLTVLLAGSVLRDIPLLSTENQTAATVTRWKKFLYEKFPGRSFAVYDYRLTAGTQSLALSLFLDADNRVDEGEIPIGVSKIGLTTVPEGLLLTERDRQLFDLRATPSAVLSEYGWALMIPRAVYEATQEWRK